jgi:hypothetical protein
MEAFFMWYIYIIFFSDGFYYVGKRKCPISKTPWSDKYCGSPCTHREKWFSGTPYTKIVHTFGITTDREAKNQETQLLRNLGWKTDLFCLNEWDNESWTEEGSSRGGKMRQEQRTSEERKEHARQVGSIHGPLSYKNKTALFAQSPDKQLKNAKAGGEASKTRKIGIFAIPPEQHSANSRKAGKTTSELRFKCLVTGHISTPGGLSRYQNARGIQTTLRVKLIHAR